MKTIRPSVFFLLLNLLALVLVACGDQQSQPSAAITAATSSGVDDEGGDENAEENSNESPDTAAAELAASQARLNLEITLGSASKRLCSSLFVSGRSEANIMAEELSSPALAAVEFSILEDRVISSLSGMSVTALFRPMLGCTLVKDDSVTGLLTAVNSDRLVKPIAYPDAQWPEGNEVLLPDTLPGDDLQAVNVAVDEAFLDMEPDQDIDTRAVLVIKDGRIIAEQYAEPFHADMPQLGWSMTKTVIGTLTGQLAAEGIVDVNAPAPVPEWQGEDDPRGEITLEDLLQMSSGLRFSEVYTAGSMSDVILMLYTTGDTGGFAINQPQQYAPGTEFSYSSGTSNIISHILRDALADQYDYLNYPREALFNPLGMASATMELDASGTYVASSYMYATPRDWARLGLLYLNDGQWQGEQLLPEGWVEYATTPAESAEQGNYGAQIWLNAGPTGDAESRALPNLPANMVYLSGFEGQNILLFPDHDLIVMRMGLTTRGPRPVWTLAEKVLAAIE